MRLATWNINGIRARLDYLLLWLRESRPEVVGLQELKAPDDVFPYDELAAEGYHAAVHGQPRWNGVAILSREPAEVTQRGLPGQESAGARLLSARVSGIDFTTVYVPNGKDVDHDDFPAKLAWIDDLLSHVQAHTSGDRPAVLCGDFNLVPAPLDSWNEEKLGGGIFHTEAERGRFQQLLAQGWTDLFRHHEPTLPGFSWWDYRRGAFHKKQGLRIDLLLATNALASRLQDVHVPRKWRKKQEGLTPSDHAPVIANFS
jgi:exodeoxyribonuclease-3